MAQPRAFNPSDIDVRIARTPNDIAMVMAIRAAVFLAEEDDITYSDEFNGNDFTATHILALVDGDPAGVVRCRWFAEFALIERIGIRKRYRCYPLLSALARGALDHCRQKGYRTVAGRARGDSVKFWKRLGGVQSGPVMHHVRGIVTPIVHDLQPKPGLDVVPYGPFGHPAFEDLITQEEGRWNFSRMIAVGVAAE